MSGSVSTWFKDSIGCGEIEPLSATLAQDGLAECDQPKKNPLKYSAVAGNWTRATRRTNSELSHWAIMTDGKQHKEQWHGRISGPIRKSAEGRGTWPCARYRNLKYIEITGNLMQSGSIKIVWVVFVLSSKSKTWGAQTHKNRPPWLGFSWLLSQHSTTELFRFRRI